MIFSPEERKSFQKFYNNERKNHHENKNQYFPSLKIGQNLKTKNNFSNHSSTNQSRKNSIESLFKHKNYEDSPSK